MSDSEINRRELIVTAAGAGAAGTLVGVVPAVAQTPATPPIGFQNEGPPFAESWRRELSEITRVNLGAEFDAEEVRERHRIYCYLLMKLIYRFWNGNKRGPFGTYPQRAKQIEFSKRSGKMSIAATWPQIRKEAASIGTAISGTTSPASPSMATARSSISISTTMISFAARSSTPSRAWCDGCSA
ncbi:hypothetical protein [Bradyrhizobium sp.]|jgi:hypothetical protein|uniref:hypothetical protein n=1 Tax=Bradyrhizobium sp. TaxID=376 RepID=UPI002BE66C8E|nr:hypothetical protein [Bradyrhizobium sp.]HWX57278.1 hypothetical protein [Bradyrhizobium sp.]